MTTTSSGLNNVVEYTTPDGHHVFGTVAAIASLNALLIETISAPTMPLIPTVDQLETAGFVFDGMGRISGDLGCFARLATATQPKENAS